jgi:sugar/nucleoside kinase (ribokinase family)
VLSARAGIGEDERGAFLAHEGAQLGEHAARGVTGGWIRAVAQRGEDLDICEAARRRGIPVLLDADRPTTEDDPLFAIPTHVIFSSECLRGTTGLHDLEAGLLRMAPRTRAFVAVSDGPGPIRYVADGRICAVPVFKVDVIDTLAAGDVFHAGIALALAEGRDEIAAMRFGAAAAGLKCTRFGGSMGAPKRDEVEAFLAKFVA